MGRKDLRSDHQGAATTRMRPAWANRASSCRLPVLALLVTGGLVISVLGGCSSSEGLALPKINDINPFAKKETPLPGKRVAIMDSTGSIAGTLAPADRPIILPPPMTNESWPQPGGTPANAPGHLALSTSPKIAWSADAGSGSSSTGKVTASPIVFDGRVYTLDAQARVTAFSINGGSSIWRTSLVPDTERKAGSMFTLGSSSTAGGYGGGIAADNGRLFVATGYGTVSALDPKTGKVLWTKSQGSPVRASPTAAGDRVYVVSTEGRVAAYAASDGAELWQARGLSEQSSIVGSPSPAVDGDVVVVPFPSGEVVGYRVSNGEQLWSESLTRAKGSSAMGALSDAGRPAIDRGTVFASAHGGRTSAVQLRTGERLWSANIASIQTPRVAGDFVFVVDTAGQLLCLSRRDGQTLWTIKLPDSPIWSGPTLAGGQLWLVSSRGALVGVEATTGRIISQATVGAPTFIAPIVSNGQMFVLTDTARLIAYK